MVELQLADLFGPLRRHEVDAMCVRLPLRQLDLTIGPVLSVEPRVLLVGRKHELATRAEASLEVLADHALVDVRGLPPELAEDLLPSRTPAGRVIPRGPVLENMAEVQLAVATGMAVYPTGRSTPQFRGHPEIVSVPLTDAPTTSSALVTQKGHANLQTTAVLAAAETSLAARSERAPSVPTETDQSG